MGYYEILLAVPAAAGGALVWLVVGWDQDRNRAESKAAEWTKRGIVRVRRRRSK